MATKKNTKKVGKKSAKKVAKKRAKPAPIALTPAERSRKLRPRRDYRELIETFLRVWEENPSVRLTGLTRAQLRRALGLAIKAADKEDALRREADTKLRVLMDARLVAEDDLWRKLLDANALVRAQSRVDPRLAEAFAFLSDALRPESRERDDAEEPAAG
ncbi:hypothetical protein [Sandaracinus amylolyticus]|uniref:hypothetical protein n=1 Tax=Sandaracinus amylolyticus TaxID=927083 RepID=UPI00069CD691|nr:hypothetical protein [Sandaracinus amylolyticus]